MYMFVYRFFPYLLVVALACSLAFPGTAYAVPNSNNYSGESAVELQQDTLGNPNLEGASPEVIEAQTQSNNLAAPLTPATKPNAALLTNALTSAYIDTDAATVYAATRSASPAQLFVHKYPGGTTTEYRLPVGTGSWDMAKSGNTLAIGITAPSASKTTWVQGFNTGTSRFTQRATLPASNIVMALAEDTFEAEPGNGRFFWAGTYDTSGACLYRVDLQNGTATLRGSWSAPSHTYVRSLSVSPRGVIVGLGTTGRVATISEPGTNASINSSLSAPISDTSFCYAQASAELSAGSFTVIGTEQPARLAIFNNLDGKNLATHTLAPGKTVDRIAIDSSTHIAWFTTRPYGTLMSSDLTDPTAAPVNHGTPVWGSETRALSATDGTIRGVTGTGELWTFNTATGETTTAVIVPPTSEAIDSIPQGIVQFAGYTLVGGHWRYQAHKDSTSVAVSVPGEPKTQVVVGDRMYAALYPSGTIYAVNSDLSTERVMTVNTENMRPSAIEYNSHLKQLIMAIGPVYGSYGGALVVSGTATNSQFHTYTNPVGTQKVTALEPYGAGALIGTSTVGEAKPAINTQTAQVRFWLPNGNATTGMNNWIRTIPNAMEVTGIEYVEDVRGNFVVAVGTDKSGEGWVAGLDADSGELLWKSPVSTWVKNLQQADGQLSALIGGTLRQIGASRTNVALTMINKGVSGSDNTNLAYSSASSVTNGKIQVASVTAGSSSMIRSATLTNPRVTYRIAGDDRFATAVAVSKNTYESADTVFLVRYDNYADALAAGPLAARLNAPILLVNGNKIDAATRAEIVRLGAKQAIAIGGTGVIPDTISAALPSGVKLSGRLGGRDRYQTSLLIAKRIEALAGQKLPVLVATGTNFADALSGGPAAVRAGGTILLYDPLPGTEANRAFLTDRNIAALGGPAANGLRKSGLKPEVSLVGSDRYATARLVANKYFPASANVYLAYGMNFPDGLSAAPLAGKAGAPLLLANTRDLTASTKNAITAGHGQRRVYLIGGPGVLADTLYQQAVNL